MRENANLSCAKREQGEEWNLLHVAASHEQAMASGAGSAHPGGPPVRNARFRVWVAGREFASACFENRGIARKATDA